MKIPQTDHWLLGAWMSLPFALPSVAFFFFFLNIWFWFSNLCLITTCFYHMVGMNAIVVCLAGIKQVNPEKLQFFRAMCLCVWVCGCAKPARTVPQTTNNQQNLQPASIFLHSDGGTRVPDFSVLFSTVEFRGLSFFLTSIIPLSGMLTQTRTAGKTIPSPSPFLAS